MKNQDIRVKAKEKKVRLWQIADKLNINDGNFSRLLRHQLSKEKKEQIFKIIDELAKGGGANDR